MALSAAPSYEGDPSNVQPAGIQIKTVSGLRSELQSLHHACLVGWAAEASGADLPHTLATCDRIRKPLP